MELPIEQQIEIFKKAKEIFERYDHRLPIGMCVVLSEVCRTYGRCVGLFNFKYTLPTFTRDNVFDLSLIDKFTPPNMTTNDLDYWWNVTNTKVRLKVFDSLIKQLENL